MSAGFLIVTVEDNGDPREVARLLEPLKGSKRLGVETIEVRNKVVFAGTRARLARLKNQKPLARPELEAAFGEVDGASVALVVMPSDDNRRVLREMLPRLPNELGGGSGRAVADGLSWALLRIDLPPKPKIDVVIQSRSADSARQLKVVLASLYLTLSQNEVFKKGGTNVDEVLAAITPRIEGDRLMISLTEENGRITKVVKALSRPLEAAQAAVHRRRSTNNLKRMGIAFHNFHDTYKRFPAAANFAYPAFKSRPAGTSKHPHSWRVAILPYLDEADLYEQYRFDEPWDSEHNRKLIPKMPEVFLSPSASPLAALRTVGKTTYLAPVGEGTIFAGKEGTHIRDIKDGTSNTIMLVEAHPSRAVIWTKPDDLAYDPKEPLRGLSGQKAGGFVTVFCDGSGHFISDEVDANTLRAMFTQAAGDFVVFP